MNIFLRLKHWQLFILLMGLPIIMDIFTIGNPMALIKLFPIMMMFFIFVFFGWFYALGMNLNKKLPDTVKMNLTKFKWFFFIPIIYMLLICMFLIVLRFSNILNTGQAPSPIILLIIPVHLFSVFCIFYCLYFSAKSLKAVELQKPVTFNDYAGEFFLIWFFPIGVWFIQPRINKLFDDTIQE